MKLRFLCANHRMLLQSDIKKALTVFQAGFDSGHYYFWQADWSEATPHLGCAFEVAELILTQTISQKEASRACIWLTTSALLLAHSFNNINNRREAEDIILLTINRIERQLVNNPTQAVFCSRHLERLYDELANISNGKLAATTASHFDEVGISNSISRIH
jgi:hypothetical protein